MSVPVLMQGTESWSHIHSAEIKCMRYVRGCTKNDKIRNETIKSNLNIFSFNYNIEENKSKQKYQVNRKV